MARVRLYQHANLLVVAHVRNLLESAGIACELRNTTLGGGAGELPPGDCEPAVWVERRQLAGAQALLDEALTEPARPRQVWACPRCGECLDGVFDACWQCGTARPDRV
ncbi:putative signal transducing protein [Modicisalibacter radicis]|uniref:putative signal transducing protein n=1 Tax=Halomonas sp. EAR18 TaxID=2518972 RepID=UPI00109D7AB4|nr:DUF2007 domain-containing protein [Halomonas sp. EAR18]